MRRLTKILVSLALLLPFTAAPALADTASDLAALKQFVTVQQAAIRELRADLQSQRTNAIGLVMAFAGTEDKIPEGWMIADGRELSRVEYAKLHAIIGATYGSAGEGTFRLPDYRGLFLRGLDLDAGYDPGRALGDVQQHSTALPRNPFVTGGQNDGAHSHANGAFDRLLHIDGGGTLEDPDNTPWEPNLFKSEPMTAGTHSHVITGGGDAETRPSNRSVIYVIKVK